MQKSASGPSNGQLTSLVENYTILISYYSFVNNQAKLDFFQKRLKNLLENKVVSNELEASTLRFSKLRSSHIQAEAYNPEHKNKVWQEVKANQERSEITERIISRELAFQEKKIQIR